MRPAKTWGARVHALRRAAAAAAAAWLLISSSPLQASAATRVWLPVAAAPPQPDPCAVQSPGPWEVRCGGFGRIRDLYARQDGAALAIGDGAALFQGGAWIPQLGGGLHGLEALSIAEPSPDSARGWAVGEADLIVQMRNRVWTPYAPGERDFSVDLTGISTEGETWAAGEKENRAAFRWLRFDAGEEGRWYDVPAQPLWPPIDDLFIAADRAGRPAGWAVGSLFRGGQGTFMRYDGTWTIAQDAVGQPEELAMTSVYEGWAVGTFFSEPAPSLAFWRMDQRTGGQWLEEPSLRMAGRRLLDAYQTSEGAVRWFVALEPTAGSAPVLLGYQEDQDAWLPLALPDPLFASPRDVAAERLGNHAIAPLADGSLLYAWGDDVWRYVSDPRGWTRVRVRRELGPLAAGWSAAMLLSPNSAELLVSTTRWTAPDLRSAIGEGALAFLDGSPSRAWALGRDGAAMVIRGPMGRWTQWLPTERPTDVTAIAAEGDTVLAAGRDGAGLAIWRGDAESWRQTAAAPDKLDVALSATGLATWPGGWAWAAAQAVADVPGAAPSPSVLGAVVAVSPDCAAPCAATVWPFGVPIAAVTAASADEAWAAGQHVLVHCRGGSCRQEESSPAPSGSRFVALASGAPDDVWAVLHEGSLARPSSLVIHYDGTRWRTTCRVDVAVSGARVTARFGRRALWLAGDWETVIRHEYGNAIEAEAPCGPA